MAKAKRGGLVILSANDLVTGAVVYWTGEDWSREPNAAIRVRDVAQQDALVGTMHAEEAANRVVSGQIIPVDPITGQPLALRERHREAGPSIQLPSA